MTYATDRRSIIDSSLYGMAEPAASPITPVLAKYHNGSVKRCDFDLARAAQILDDAGWKVGAHGIRSKDGKPLKFVPTVEELIAEPFDIHGLSADPDRTRRIARLLELVGLAT